MSAQERFASLSKDMGRAALSALFPEDFEFYLCAFELVDSEDNTVKYLSFPVMPSSITKQEQSAVNVKKTIGGVSATTNTSYIPQNITIKGSFGRKFKILFISRNISKNFSKSGFSTELSVFDKTLKTGFGVTKLLQKMMTYSNKLDNYGKPYRLYFYNLALSESYWVKAINRGYSQDKEKNNMMWDYDIQLKTVASLDDIVGLKKRDRKVEMAQFMAQKLINIAGSELAKKVTVTSIEQIFKKS